MPPRRAPIFESQPDPCEWPLMNKKLGRVCLGAWGELSPSVHSLTRPDSAPTRPLPRHNVIAQVSPNSLYSTRSLSAFPHFRPHSGCLPESLGLLQAPEQAPVGTPRIHLAPVTGRKTLVSGTNDYRDAPKHSLHAPARDCVREMVGNDGGRRQPTSLHGRSSKDQDDTSELDRSSPCGREPANLEWN